MKLFAKKYWERLLSRWRAPDYNGGTPRFQIKILGKDLIVFVGIPLSSIILYKVAEGISLPSKSRKSSVFIVDTNPKITSQIIRFETGISNIGVSKRAPGTLVRVRLLNAVESYEGASAHAQVVDGALGSRFLGSDLIGDVVSDETTKRIRIDFHFAKDAHAAGVAIPIAARAMGLDGTAGLPAEAKEGFFARSALRVGATVDNQAPAKQDFRTLVAQMVAGGMVDELKDGLAVNNKRAHLLTLRPGLEFYAELTDFFPASGR